MSVKRFSYKIEGTIQGVGFRPFLFRLANRYQLAGFAHNSSDGVILEAEGDISSIRKFEESLANELPPLACITSINKKEIAPLHQNGFEIQESQRSDVAGIVQIPPDVATCSACASELADPKNRRYQYPFTNCTDCGPRYTIIESLPYDRRSTTMSEFIICEDCSREYNNPLNRRFHAEPNACDICGPNLTLMETSSGQIIEKAKSDQDIIKMCIRKLESGNVLAIKGLGGFHLACDADNSEAVTRLRQGKNRPARPLAVMSLNIENISSYAHIKKDELALLNDPRRPIVLVEKNDQKPLAMNIAPNNDFYGVMFPYTPLHFLLLQGKYRALVMTSANNSGEPIIKDNKEAQELLSSTADYLLLHNRKILVRCDDSLVRWDGEAPSFIRLSRGWAPLPLKMQSIMPDRLACGAELKNTFCLVKQDRAFVSGHIGNLESKGTFDAYSENITHLEKILDIKPQVVIHDLHPDYLSTQYAFESPIERKVEVQHHHAHILSLMAEHNIENRVIGIALDGTGYGTDGTIWGGEILLADRSDFHRFAYLEPMPLPGGDAAAREPWRMALSLLALSHPPNYEDILREIVNKRPESELANSEKTNLIFQMIAKRFNSPLSSGAGRLFAAVAALLGIKESSTFEGEAEMNLEWMAGKSQTDEAYETEMDTGSDTLIIRQGYIFRQIVDDYLKGIEPEKVARKFHNTVVEFISKAAYIAYEQTGLKKVLLSGGVMQNMLILAGLRSKLRKKGLEVFAHSLIPANDAGIALGQAYYIEKE